MKKKDIKRQHLRGIYNGMRYRCYDEQNKSYKNYGGRGIKVCDEWVSDKEKFFSWAENNGYKIGLSIERIDNDGNYSPENCKWATDIEQANNKRTSDFIEYNGEVKTLTEWANHLGINQTTLFCRIHRKGWGVEKAFTTPVRVLRKDKIKCNGESHSIAEWSKISGIKQGTIRNRLFLYGWNPEKAIFEAPNYGNRA